MILYYFKIKGLGQFKINAICILLGLNKKVDVLKRQAKYKKKRARRLLAKGIRPLPG